jgi:hypothetical protein
MFQNKKVYPDKNYYDITISNLNTSTTVPPIINFNESRTQPYLDKPEDYYLSIIRFSVDTGQILPVFIPEIQLNQSDINLTIYSVSLQKLYNGIFYTEQTFISWYPQDRAAALPTPPNKTTNGFQDNVSGYYYCLQIQYFLNLVNTAFRDCLAGLNSQVGNTIDPNPPVITFDTQNQKFVLYCDQAVYSINAGVDTVSIFMNPPLYQLFGSLPATVNSYSGRDSYGVLKGLVWKIQPDLFAGSSITPFPFVNPQYDAIQVVQERSSISMWCPVVAVVFCSTTLPVATQNVSAPQIFVDGITQQQSNNSTIAPIITDIIADNAEYTPFILYNPLAEYRLVSMHGTNPLSNIDIQVYWRDKFGVLNPLRLPSGASCSLKILFTKKSTNQNK